MTATAVLVFVPACLTGILLVHLMWPDRAPWNLALKVFLGTGIGLGIRSLLYFLYLLVLPGSRLYTYFDLVTLIVVSLAAWAGERRHGRDEWFPKSRVRLSGAQAILLVLSSAVAIASMLAIGNYLLRRRQGDWDAWMTYNRVARFLYSDQGHWRESFSPVMSPIFHSDYPLLLSADITAAWEMIGRDSVAVPLVQSGLFAIVCAGLLVTALGSVKSGGQAALGLVWLWGVPAFVNEGARQIADVPLAFFMLATIVLIFLYALRRQGGLLLLAGLTTGLAGWTKNEGTVFLGAASIALVIGLGRRAPWRSLLPFVVGIALPLAVLAYFKLAVAPFGDILSGASGGLLPKLLNWQRHSTILAHYWSEFSHFGTWGIAGLAIGILPILLIYYLLFRAPNPPDSSGALLAGLTMLGIQLLGYYAAYLVSPYDLAWHLAYSSARIMVQVYPLILFLVLAATRPAEDIISAPAAITPE